jgi:hypothetical protein
LAIDNILKVYMKKTIEDTFPPLDLEMRIVVNTATAAHHLNRRKQTLRTWACKENGPIRPLRINGRLAWPVLELRHLLSGSTVMSKGAQA